MLKQNYLISVFILCIFSIFVIPIHAIEVSENISVNDICHILNMNIIKFPLPQNEVSAIILWIDIYTNQNTKPIKTIPFASVTSEKKINGDFIFCIGYDQPPLFNDNEYFVSFGVHTKDKYMGTRDFFDLSEYINLKGRKLKAFRKRDELEVTYNQPISIYQLMWGEKIRDCNFDDIVQLVNSHDLFISINIMLIDEQYKDYDPITRTYKK